MSKFNSHTGVIYEVVTPKDSVRNDKTPLQKDILADPGKKLHFAVKENV